MKSYIKVKTSDFPKSITKIRELDNEFWKEHIFSYLLSYYSKVDNSEIQKLIEKENQKQRAEIEKALKKHIRRWFDKNIKFQNEGFILNNEPSAQGENEGFYDLKFQHSFWNYTKSYFPFECKNLGKAKSMTLQKSIEEYVFTESEGKIDGGMYRHFIDKYSVNQDFGGMIGFVISKAENSIVDQLIKKIEVAYTDNPIGRLTEEKIIRNSIFENANTFDSLHLRINFATRESENFRMHHLIMDFVEANMK